MADAAALVAREATAGRRAALAEREAAELAWLRRSVRRSGDLAAPAAPESIPPDGA